MTGGCFFGKTESKMKHTRNANRATPPKKDNTPVRVRKEKWKSIIVDIYMKGYSQERTRQLAGEQTGHSFGIKFVNSAIAEAVEQWKASKQEMIDNHKAIELERINRLETTYWEAWQRSLQSAKTRTEKKTKGKAGDGKLAVAEVENATRETSGDPRFLQGIQWCVDTRCKLLGIEVPTPSVAVQINNNNTGPGSQSTTINRRIVFQTRETTVAPQIIQETNEE